MTSQPGRTGISRLAHSLTALLVASAIIAAAAPQAASAAPSGTSDAILARTASPKVTAGAPREQSLRAFDGTWDVRSSPGCALLARSSVSVSEGRIRGPGVSGSIDAEGNVQTLGRGGSLSVVSTGKVSGEGGSGTYRVSNGCTGTWAARKRPQTERQRSTSSNFFQID